MDFVSLVKELGKQRYAPLTEKRKMSRTFVLRLSLSCVIIDAFQSGLLIFRSGSHLLKEAGGKSSEDMHCSVEPFVLSGNH